MVEMVGSEEIMPATLARDCPWRKAKNLFWRDEILRSLFGTLLDIIVRAVQYDVVFNIVKKII